MKSPKKIALLGFDCALTHLVQKHIDEGICPNFKKVFENGTVAENCLVPFPTITPPNWTSMATGAWPGTNNITDFWRHIPGTTPEGANMHNCFNWDYVASESFWEAAEAAGKKSVVMNFPMSYNVHKKLKNGVVIGGAALTPGVFMDATFVAEYKGIERTPEIANTYTFSEDTLISTDVYPGNAVRISYSKASGWSNVDNMGDDPLDATFEMPFKESLFNLGITHATWHILVRDMGDGYDTVTLSPTKDFKDAFFTVTTGKWSNAFDAKGVLEKGGTKDIRLMAKLVSLESDDASSLRLYLTHALNTDGEAWCFPQNKAAQLNKGNNVSTNNTGMLNLTLGWYDLPTWLEQIGIHYDWLADTAEALLGNPADWDIFFSHAHPTDYIYHVLMTQLDPNTCSSKTTYEQAWELHRQLYKHADRYLGRLLKLFDDETLVVLISDHGATPDGPSIDMMKLLGDAGFCAQKTVDAPEWLESVPENIRDAFGALAQRVDAAKSKAIPVGSCHIYINLKGRDPEGIVDPADYEQTQRDVIDALMTYVDPGTGKRPFCLALPKKEAMMMGLWGENCGDIIYAQWPEFNAQHGPILPAAEYGIGTLKTLCVYYGPEIGIKKGYKMQRVCNLVDLVPTFCYLTGWPLPKTAEGAVVYQIMEDINFRPACK